MNPNFCIELSDDSAQNVSGGYDFGNSSYTSIYENLNITKNLYSNAVVYGHFAGAEAEALAKGYGTSTQALSKTYTDPVTSASSATSTSATGGYYFYL